jgi:K+-sensing histidine kinase KdpD
VTVDVRTRWAVLAGLLVPMAAGAALIPLRDHLDGTNAALVLVVTVVGVAALGRRPAAVAAALSAFAAFNLFHTAPHYSLRIEASSDLETAVLLLVVGIAVGELALRARRAEHQVRRGERDLERLHGLGRLVADGEDADYVVLATATELVHLLALVDCRFEPDQVDEVPLAVVEADGTVRWGPTVWETERWGLPAEGVAIPLFARGRRHGRFVLQGQAGVPVERSQLARAHGLVGAAAAAVR